MRSGKLRLVQGSSRWGQPRGQHGRPRQRPRYSRGVSEKQKVVSDEEMLARAKEMGVEANIVDQPSKLGMGEAIFLARYRGRHGPTKTWAERRPSPARNMAQSEWSIEGFLQALGRLKDTIAKGDVEPMETFIPLFEVLHWVTSAKIESELEGREKKLARAIRFAGNRVGHHWAKSLCFRDVAGPTAHTNLTAGSRLIHTALVATWCWQPANKLPIPKHSRHLDKKVGERLYRKHLADRAALEALDAIAAALQRRPPAASWRCD